MTGSPRRSLRLLLGLAFLLALAFTAVHGVRTVQDAIYWREHHDEPIQDWMTVGFVAHSYHVPPYVLLALHLPLGPPPDKRTLADIAAARGQSMGQLAAALGDVIVHARPPYPPPPPPPKAPRP